MHKLDINVRGGGGYWMIKLMENSFSVYLQIDLDIQNGINFQLTVFHYQ